jgi:hypothetical protein
MLMVVGNKQFLEGTGPEHQTSAIRAVPTRPLSKQPGV